MKPFTGIHSLPSRDLSRDWSFSKVKTKLFDVDKQPVTSFQHPWELGALLDIYVKRKPKGVLELGPYNGGTLYWFLLHAAAGATVGTVDFFDELLGAREATPEDWKKWTKKGIDFKHFEGDTHDPKIQDAVSTHFEDGIDWLFIDANHEYEHVLQDFTDYGAMVNEGGGDRVARRTTEGHGQQQVVRRASAGWVCDAAIGCRSV